MTTENWIAVVTLFATTVISGFVLFFKMGRIVESIATMQETLKDVAKIKYSYGQLIVEVDVLWRNQVSKSNSPMILNDVGLKILESSRIDSFTTKYYSEILAKVKARKPFNPYQVQEALISIVSDYQNIEECKLSLQESAFNCGFYINSLLLVAAINILDKVVSDLGFGHEDADRA